MSGARVESEIGILESVIVHTPGREIESMTPQTAREVLYNDIIPIASVSDEHAMLKAFLATLCTVHELTDLATLALEDDQRRMHFIESVCDSPIRRARIEELEQLSSKELVESLVSGVAARGSTFSEVLDGRQYDLPPLPNLYFMRDSGVVIGDRTVIGAMAHQVRRGEALLVRAAFDGGGDLESQGRILDGPAVASPEITLEGGDILVLRRDLVLVGISERTSSGGVDLLAERLQACYGAPLTVVAVLLPQTRSTIHLDMVFTQIDESLALVYEPLILGRERKEVLILRVDGGRRTITRELGLISALEKLGLPFECVACGGTDSVTRQREQWLSGNNALAFAPGKVIVYDFNEATVRELERAGFAIREVDRFVSGDDSVDNYERLCVTTPGINLARGGGGPRCMTLPVRRRPVN